MPRRVSSPSAAKTGALPRPAAAVRARADMLRDVLQLLRPAAVVHAEGLGATSGRDAVEARLDQRQARARRRVFQAELDERGRLLRVVDLRVDRVGMPAVGEQALGL